MKFDTDELRPWHDIFGMLGRMRRLVVTVDGAPVGPEADISIDNHGVVTLALDAPEKPKKGKRA